MKTLRLLALIVVLVPAAKVFAGVPAPTPFPPPPPQPGLHSR